MFKYISRKVNNTVNHKNTQKAIFKTIVTTRKANNSIKLHTTRLAEETKQTWTDAMNADI